jgi:hypothetical protein
MSLNPRDISKRYLYENYPVIPNRISAPQVGEDIGKHTWAEAWERPEMLRDVWIEASKRIAAQVLLTELVEAVRIAARSAGILEGIEQQKRRTGTGDTGSQEFRLSLRPSSAPSPFEFLGITDGGGIITLRSRKQPLRADPLYAGSFSVELLRLDQLSCLAKPRHHRIHAKHAVAVGVDPMV